jgi:flagellar protein FlgJ
MNLTPTSAATLANLGLSTDARALGALQNQANTDPHAAIRQAAKQLESLFMQELMKSMRDTTLSDGWLDNQASNMGNDMLDQQYATQMSGMPGGLADLIARQLEHQLGTAQGSAPSSPQGAGAGASAQSTPYAPSASTLQAPAPVTAPPAVSAAAGAASGSATDTKADFVRRHLAAALAAQADTGIPAANLLGQAAHESGWGRHEIRNADGTPSHNLFGIKAGPGWHGPVARVTTTEYVGGQPRKVVATFRSYASYDEAFRDHARLLKDSPRYHQVVAQGDTAAGFANGLQRAGYATDPAYAQKLTRIINTTVQLQRLVT